MTPLDHMSPAAATLNQICYAQERIGGNEYKNCEDEDNDKNCEHDDDDDAEEPIFLHNRRLISIVDFIHIITHAAFIAIIVDAIIFAEAAITIASVMFVTVVMRHYLICALACTSGNHDVLPRK